MKTITICDKEYDIDCNALTYIKYKSFFNTGYNFIISFLIWLVISCIFSNEYLYV